MVQRSLLIGATGLLGEPVARALDDAGFSVRMTSRNVSRARAKFSERFEIVEVDALKRADVKFDHSLHAGGNWIRGGGIRQGVSPLLHRDRVVIVIAFGTLTGADGPRIKANLPTPWVGVWERINIAAFLLWVAVLAVTLLRAQAEQPEKGVAEACGSG